MAFKPMLACKADPAKLRFPLCVQPKFDGIRASVVDGQLVSRTLKPIPNAEIFQALSRPEFEGLDGELIVGPPTASDAYRRTSSFVMAPNKTGEPWTFYVFDKWNHLGPFIQRCDSLMESWPVLASPHIISLVHTQTVASPDELERIEQAALSEGHEGVILRDPSGLYKFGRASATKGELIKLKRFDDFEAVVVGVYEEMHNANKATTNALGRTERSTRQAGKVGKGTLGGLILVADNGPFAGVEFRCGTGFDAADRAALWAKGEGLNGCVAKVKYFAVGVKDKPRHPVFLGWRHAEDRSE